MIAVLLALLFAVLALRHALPAGLGREAVIGVLFSSTLGLSFYAGAPQGPGPLPAVTVAVTAAGVAAGYPCRRLLIVEDPLC